jgi:CRP-like cAMP-binding protein
MKLAAEIQEFMRNNPLFMDLENDDFIKVVENTTLCELKAGENLFRQQQPATELFLVVVGKMKLSLLSSEGSEKVVDIIHAGNTFAEALIFKGMSGYPLNADALSDVTLLRINAETFVDILKNSPDACFKVMACLTIRLHWLVNELDRLSLHNARYRLISYLLENIPVETTTATVVELSVAKHVIASRISVTPETFSRTLRLLSQDGLLEVHDEHIVLTNPSKLQKMLSF